MPSGPSTRFLDFDLEIGFGAGRAYPVTVLYSPAGEARGVMRFPADDRTLASVLANLHTALLDSDHQRRAAPSPGQRAVREFGQTLFDALFTGEVRSRYDVSQQQAANANVGLRLRLRIRPPELAVLPWEYLYDAREGDYLCLSRNTPIIRYPELPQAVQPLPVVKPLRILGVVAAPRDLPALDVTQEQARIGRALASLQAGGQVNLTWLAEPTVRALQRALRAGPWHIFHFVGHGGFDSASDEGFVVLTNDTGQSQPLFATQLARLLADQRSLRLVLLNACEGSVSSEHDIFSSVAAILTRRGMPAVLAMQDVITDQAALEFARAFYEAVADGLPVEAAVSEGRKTVSLVVGNTVEWGAPVLTMRAPEGTLFAVSAGPVAVEMEVEVTPPVEAEKRGSAEDVLPTLQAPRPGPIAAHWLEMVSPRSHAAAAPARIAFDWVEIPAGPFWMGSDRQSEHNIPENETPMHSVTLGAYRISRAPVTVAQFAAFVQATGYVTTAEKQGWGFIWAQSKWKPARGASWRTPQGAGSHIEQKAQHPVTCVSWIDASAFCAWAGVQLPSEAEWEKAARGADGQIYPWGNEAPDLTRCNFDRNGGDTSLPGTFPLGASPYGVLDMAGNVWEWTRSAWGQRWEQPDFAYPYDPADGREDVSRIDLRRVLRGGSWHNGAHNIRAALRYRGNTDNRSADVGFRVTSSHFGNQGAIPLL